MEKSDLTFNSVIEASAVRFNHDAENLNKALGFSEGEHKACMEKFHMIVNEVSGKEPKSAVIERLVKASAPAHWRLMWLINIGRMDCMERVSSDPVFLMKLLTARAEYEQRKGGAEE